MIEAPATILIVIPCLNEEAHLAKLVNSLLQSNPAETSRIVIADGGSTDSTPQIATELARQHPHIFYLHNPKKLQAAAVNLAAQTYGEGAKYLIRIDAHADYPADYCQRLIEEALSTEADAVVVAMQTVGITPFQRAVAAAQNSKLGNGGSSHRSEGKSGKWVDHGHHALMRLTAFNAVGGYDECFSHNEDAELDYRLKQGGYTIWLTNRTSLVYYPRSSPWRLFRQYVGYGSGRARTFLKHHMRPKLRQIIPSVVVPSMVLALATPLTAWAIFPLMLWMIICLSYGFLLARRTEDKTIAMAGPAAMLMHAGWSLGFWITVTKVWLKRS